MAVQQRKAPPRKRTVSGKKVEKKRDDLKVRSSVNLDSLRDEDSYFLSIEFSDRGAGHPQGQEVKDMVGVVVQQYIDNMLSISRDFRAVIEVFDSPDKREDGRPNRRTMRVTCNRGSVESQEIAPEVDGRKVAP